MITLPRLLIVSLTLLLGVLFAGYSAINLYNKKLFLQSQMLAHAQDAATSLALSMSNAAALNDLATLNSMSDAIFDSGYYQHLVLTDSGNNILLERHNQSRLEHIPSWFLNSVKLPAPAANKDILGGWSPIGTLSITANPGYAYSNLWRTFEEAAWLFTFVLVFSYGLIGLLIKAILSPLQQMELQAEAICRKDFQIQSKLPFTRELKRVVLAMNNMAQKLMLLFDEQIALTEALRKESRLDDVTGLANRRDFDSGLNALIEESEIHGCALVLLQIKDFAGFNQEHGHLAGDQLLQQVARLISSALEKQNLAKICRRGGADFAIFLPNINQDEARYYLQKVFTQISANKPFDQSLANHLHLGMVYCLVLPELNQLLADADHALRRAQGQGPNGVYFQVRQDDLSLVNAPSRHAKEWQQLLQQVIQDKSLMLYFQPVYSYPDKNLIHYEVLSRIRWQDEIISAGVFIPMAERFGLLNAIDLLMLQQLATFIRHHFQPQLKPDAIPVFSVNLAPNCIGDKHFAQALSNFMELNSDLAPYLLIELPEYTAQLDVEKLKEFGLLLQRLKLDLALDHFGVGAAAFSYLRSMNIAYLKVHRSFIRNLPDNPDNQFYLRALLQIAHGQDIRLLADGIEHEEEWISLGNIGLDGGSGYFFRAPMPQL